MSNPESIEQLLVELIVQIETRDQSGEAWTLKESNEVLRVLDHLHSQLLSQQQPIDPPLIGSRIYALMRRFRKLAENSSSPSLRSDLSILNGGRATKPLLHSDRYPKWALPFIERIEALEADTFNYVERYRAAKLLRTELAELRPKVRDTGWASYLKLLDEIDSRALILQERIMAGEPKNVSGEGGGRGGTSTGWIQVFPGGAPGMGKR